MSGQVWGGRYRVGEVLGRGGMATVWRGRDLRLDRPVAVKVLTVAGAEDPSALDRFHREAQTVARLAHPHIVGVYDVGVDGEVPYLVLELVPGGSLADLLARGPLPVERAVRIAVETCQALGAAHSAGVIHRDIKPANLLLTSDGLVKVCDFGIARLQGTAQAKLTAPATAIGTSQYMAPEQAAGGPVDARTDLYAVGCLLYAMLTGTPPFEGDNPLGVLYQHLNQPAPTVRSRRPDVPPALDALVSRLLAKDPADRPASAAQTAQLLAAATGGPVPAGATGAAPTAVAPVAFARAAAPVPQMTAMPQTRTMMAAQPLPPGERPGRRSPVLLAAVAAVLVLLAVVGAFAWRDTLSDQQGSPAGDEPTSAPQVVPEETTPERTTPPPPADPYEAINALLTEQVQAGTLDEDDAKDLRKDLTELEKKLAERKPGRALRESREFMTRLSRLYQEGAITGDAYQAIVDSFRQIAPGGSGEDSAGGDGNDG